jgi:hypothetical protein
LGHLDTEYNINMFNKVSEIKREIKGIRKSLLKLIKQVEKSHLEHKKIKA